MKQIIVCCLLSLPSALIGQTTNFHVLYILGIHMGSLELAAHNNMGASFTDQILGYAIESAEASNCLSSASLRQLRDAMRNARSTSSFQGSIRSVREQLNRDIASNCICNGTAPPETSTVNRGNTSCSGAHNSWYTEAEPTHPWSGLGIYKIRQLGYKESFYYGSMTWGWNYFLQDPHNRSVRIFGSKVYYVDWDCFEQHHRFIRREQLPQSRNLSHKDIWKQNRSGAEFEIVYLAR